MHDQPWNTAPLVAFDLEGSGSQDHEHEAILEVGVVPLVDGRPNMQGAYNSMVNPGRRIQRRPWSSPGLTNDVLGLAPPLDAIEPELAGRLNGTTIVGHNVNVDWRLLSLRCPDIHPAFLVDTLKLARLIHGGTQRRSLTALLAYYELSDEVTKLTGGQPHRALWDAVGAGLLLGMLIHELPHGDALTVAGLHNVAGVPLGDAEQTLPLF
ncbi:3'-5' exonuclease [Streptosporangium sp. NBC_01755]|uniref:3'-5' exonuclease n=1 Tax=Streptosporangium sp. NBC_01755 TaxID=2975949 RepID=UPI002DDBD3EF|nr:3'-5' exonuclease [Streptosporangium sp. NBC_01755]WSC98668.1 3'-5' exonuclease [Streptosporangium sp. NBC_01755]